MYENNIFKKSFSYPFCRLCLQSLSFHLICQVLPCKHNIPHLPNTNRHHNQINNPFEMNRQRISSMKPISMSHVGKLLANQTSLHKLCLVDRLIPQLHPEPQSQTHGHGSIQSMIDHARDRTVGNSDPSQYVGIGLCYWQY